MKLKPIFALFTSLCFAPLVVEVNGITGELVKLEVPENATPKEITRLTSEKIREECGWDPKLTELLLGLAHFSELPEKIDEKLILTAIKLQPIKLERDVRNNTVLEIGCDYSIRFFDLHPGFYPPCELNGQKVGYPYRDTDLKGNFDLKALRLLEGFYAAKILLCDAQCNLTYSDFALKSQLIHYLLAEKLHSADLISDDIIGEISEKQPVIQEKIASLVQKHLDPEIELEVVTWRKDCFISGGLEFFVDLPKDLGPGPISQEKLFSCATINYVGRIPRSFGMFNKIRDFSSRKFKQRYVPFNQHSIAFYKACLELSNIIGELLKTYESLEGDIERHIMTTEDSLFHLFHELGFRDDTEYLTKCDQTLKEKFMQFHSGHGDPEVFGHELYEFLLNILEGKHPGVRKAIDTLKNMDYIP